MQATTHAKTPHVNYPDLVKSILWTKFITFRPVCCWAGWQLAVPAQGWHPRGVCTVQSPCIALGTELPWQPLRLKCSTDLSEEVLLPGTEDSTLKIGLFTQQPQHLHTSYLPFPFLLCPLFFFFPLRPTSFCPFRPLNANGGMISQVIDENLCGKRGPVSFRSACVGRGLSSSGCSQGNCAAPDLPLGHRWEVKLSSCCFYFSQA